MDKTIKLICQSEAQSLFGAQDANKKIIEHELKCRLSLREGDLKISGSSGSINKTTRLFDYLLAQIRQGAQETSQNDLSSLIASLKKNKKSFPLALSGLSVTRTCAGKQIGCKNTRQKEYVQAIQEHDIVFSIGPAGTGKTYLAMACAVEELKKQQVRRIILTRPAIEAGESLGFLPGDMQAKISPYLRPLYDALYDMMEGQRIEKYIETGIIEVAPLAYMRGRTLNDAFIILDEAQNCTAEQMKMFLTRLGFDSKAVITGDITQSDLPNANPVGLLQAQDILKEIPGIKFIYFNGSDVVRHSLIQKIIEAYEKTIR